MKMSNRTDKLTQARNALFHLTAQREATIERLVRIGARMKAAERLVRRREKLAAKPANAAKPALPPMRLDETRVVISTRPQDRPPAGSDEPNLEIPDFLRRQKEGEAKDAAAREEILAQQSGRKQAKSRARVGKMLAEKAGDTKRMPLTGKDALAAIRRA